MDPRSEGLHGRDPPRPPCVPVSPRPRDQVLPGVPERRSAPVSRPVPPSGPSGDISLLRQVHSMQRVRQAAAEELLKAQDYCEGLRQHLEQLEQRKEALDRSYQQVQESLQRARLQRKEVEAKGQRSCGLLLEQHQDLEGAEQKLEELQHLRREQRRQYCQQLKAIMEEHKHLHYTHAPAHLEAELAHLEKMEEKWLSWERCLMDIEEQLGPQAAVTSRLVQQGQEAAERQLEVELGQKQLALQHRDRLAEELQQLQRSLESQPE